MFLSVLVTAVLSTSYYSVLCDAKAPGLVYAGVNEAGLEFGLDPTEEGIQHMTSKYITCTLYNSNFLNIYIDLLT
jgi:hypothetical protein